MRTTWRFALALAISLGVSMVGSSGAAGTVPARDAIGKIFEHYEGVRLALLHDTTEGIADHAQAASRAVEELQKNFRVAGVEENSDTAMTIRDLLPGISQAAAALTTAEDVGDARKAFHALTTPLLELQKVASVGGAATAYCPMAGKSWLQPEGEIGNPYFGQSMAQCGAFVEE